MSDVSSLVAAIMGGVIALVTAGAIVARKLNGKDCFTQKHVEMLVKHDVAIKVLQQDLTDIKSTLRQVRDAVLVLKGEME